MKIEKLTDNKIRIILNLDDLAKKNIDVHSLIKNSSGTQSFFNKILKQAEKEVGFNAQDAKLLIEAFISADGFFILTFTKLENLPSVKKASIPKAKRKNLNPSSKTAIYDFNSFEEFCSFCTYTHNSKLGTLRKFAKYISLYEYNSKYFLIFSEIDKNYIYSNLFYTSISEFARFTSSSETFASKIQEYGKSIFKNNAIQNGMKYFSKA